MELKNSKTAENLMRAFAGESQAYMRYTLAADSLKKKGYYFLYNIFKLTANQEKAHAEIFWNHLKPLAGENIPIEDAGYPAEKFEEPEKLLSAAAHNETEEYEKVYPAFAQTARKEGFAGIAVSFEKIAQIENMHAKRFLCFAELMNGCRLFKGDESTQWMCLNCGHIFNGNPPERCPVCSEGKGYFVPYKYYNFIAEKYGIAEIL